MTGRSHETLLKLHKRYGDVVRIAPNELSYLHPAAWNDIMGHRKDGQEENIHSPEFYNVAGSDNILSADRERHARMRRLLSHGFSAARLREQEPIINSYVDLLLLRLRQLCSPNGRTKIELTSWYNFTTFDIIGDLTFGESFHCLDGSNYHPMVKAIFDSLKYDAFLGTLGRFPRPIAKIALMLLPSEVIKAKISNAAQARRNVDKRLALEKSRPDFADAMTRKAGSFIMTRDELYENSEILMNAGSETTATALSAATYFLATNPDALQRLTSEIRGAFATESEINMLSTEKLVYLKAVIEETLRAYPPLPTVLPRMIPPKGQEMMGRWVPGNTTVGVWQWPMFHDERNFSKPFKFHPERWLGDERFAGDQKEALRPFSHGPRNCLGMNLAYSELRLILSRMLWTFDLEISAESQGWLSHNAFLMWDKPPLHVYLTPRTSSV
ncbi:hypothetical protein COL26b_009534 [Colletotrichum chrysophilum]|nr:uncharacterized protein COL26b_009534 [Colletotrichum chrysophilum]KAJ0371552.1 hypothetical protein COL26b_009534 [Colletotrichum chrysophilum]